MKPTNETPRHPPGRPPGHPHGHRGAVKPLVALAIAGALLCAVFFALRGGEGVAVVAPVVVEAPPEPVVEVAPPAPASREVPELAPTVRRSREVVFPEARFSDPEQTVWGHVTDAVTRQPIDFFQTYLVPLEVGDVAEVADRQEYIRLWGNSKGAFTYREVTAGNYGLLVRREGYRDVVFRDLKVPNHRGLIEIELQRGAYVDVSVVDGDDLEGVGGIEVFLRPVSLEDAKAKLPSVMRRETDDFGKGLFTGLPPGTWRVELGNPQLSGQPEQQVYVGAEIGVPVRFVIQPLNTVTVTVKDDKGETLNGVHVRMWTKEGRGTFRDETDVDGEAILTYVPPATYTVKIWKSGYFRDDREIVIATLNGEFAVDFTMTADPLAAEGGSEANATLEEIQRLKANERQSDVFRKKRP